MKIIELQAQNVKKLRRVTIAPDGHITIIGGDEGQGKSTVLDCVVMALAGTKHVASVPIRTGETEAAIKLTLGDKGQTQLIVERTFDSAKGTSLTVRGADGKKLPGGPQEILNRLFSMVAFKPLEFASQEPEKQAETLRKLAGVDVGPIDAEIKKIYDQRTDVGRDGKNAAGQLAGMVVPAEGTPDEEVSIAALLEEKAKADKVNEAAARAKDAAAKGEGKVKEAADAVENAGKALARAEEALLKARKDLDAAQLTWGETVACAESLREVAEQSPTVDVSPIVEQMRNAETVNRAVRSKKDHARKSAEVKALRDQYETLTKQIADLEAKKSDMLKSAKWPIDGLSFGSKGILYKGLPFEQASRGERYRVSIAIGMALNPELRVLLLEDASVLDKHAMKAIREMAEAKDYDVWIERVGDGDAGALIMEDGEIKTTTPVTE